MLDKPLTTAPPPNMPDPAVFYRDDEPVKKSYRPAISSSLNALRDYEGLTAEATDAILTESAQFFAGASIGTSKAGQIHGLIVHYLKEPPTEEQKREWASETRRILRERFGEDSERRIEATRAYLAAHPTLEQQLNQSGVGAHPEVVVPLASNSHNLRAKPRKAEAK